MKNHLRVLVIDDEEELVSALVERMMLRSIDAYGAITAREALRKLQEEDIDVVVLDVKMPGMDGLELLKKIKVKHPLVQVILLTGRGSEKECEVGLAEGAFDYLIKPIDIEELIGRMKLAANS
ncbi:MAG: response regulator [Candidatus Abyssobacteria bacterium SURF_5]|uniref:Response regulator n=1 Tax=Abyssobacteria bacterium (strain SURF_5) TaxID=2093360 RepID=A0A3A4ND61_ABYX5|nr:MAG: response regulator [Candidatus Abyssubacteria bacterium SURF_5]